MKSTNSFDDILEALIQQRHLLEEMEAENETLRQQLADLRAGHGVFIDIQGTRIPLAVTEAAHVMDVVSDQHAPAINAIEEASPVPAVAAPVEQEDSWLLDTSAIKLPEPDLDPDLQETTLVLAAATDPTRQPTVSIASEGLQEAEQDEPTAASDFVIEDVPENEGEPAVPAGSSASFLEDALVAEFATASNRHMGNWSGPITNSPLANGGPITNNPDLDEEAKAALRRELMGSYILE